MTDLNTKLSTAWEGFAAGDWQKEVNVRDFIQKNYTPYEGDEAFLAGASAAATSLWEKVMEGIKIENRTHAPVDFDTDVGAAMSFGRVSTFLDVFIERDLKAGKLTEDQAQELIDHLVMKLRMVRFLRTPEYDELFSGDPIWATESLGGMGIDGRTLVTKNSFRFLNTLYTMGPSPEPNMTILWSEKLPMNFKKFTAKVSIDTSSVQYENDDLMRPDFNNDDYAIACCVSPMVVGKQMQFFGARANLAKTMLYAINGGVDEKLKMQVRPKWEPLADEVLDYDRVLERTDHFMDWLAKQYVTALNIIHYMHDKYSYEASLMALHDRDVYRTMACGIAGLSIAADSLSAIKYAKVTPIRDEDGLAIDFNIEGEYPQFGNNDLRVDDIACDLLNAS